MGDWRMSNGVCLRGGRRPVPTTGTTGAKLRRNSTNKTAVSISFIILQAHYRLPHGCIRCDRDISFEPEQAMSGDYERHHSLDSHVVKT